MSMPPPPAPTIIIAIAATKKLGRQVSNQLLERVTFLRLPIPMLIESVWQVLGDIRIIVIRRTFILVIHQLRRVSRRLLSLSTPVLAFAVSTLPIAISFSVAETLLRSRSRHFRRVHLVRAEVEADT